MFVENNEEAETINDSESNNEEYETDGSTENETETTDEGKQQREPETPEAKRARLKRQLEQLDKKHGFKDEDSKGESKKAPKEEVNPTLEEKYNRLALKTEGYVEKGEQDIVLDYALYKKIDIDEAIKSPIVKGEIKAYRDKAATPSPSSRTTKGGTATVDTLVTRYKAGKYLSPDEMKQVRKKLRG